MFSQLLVMRVTHLAYAAAAAVNAASCQVHTRF
jgi:hypothetical protein